MRAAAASTAEHPTWACAVLPSMLCSSRYSPLALEHLPEPALPNGLHERQLLTNVQRPGAAHNLLRQRLHLLGVTEAAGLA